MEKKYQILIFVMMITFLVVYGILWKKGIDNNLTFALGTLSSQKSTLKNGVQIQAIFYYKNVRYIASNNIDGVNCSKDNFIKKAYQRRIFVAFDSLNPNNNFLVTTREEHSKYNLKYPLFLDSLQNCDD